MSPKSAPGLLRRPFLALPFLLPRTARAQSTPCLPPRVLVVCPAGTVKSAIARETIKRRARERAVPVEVTSRGLRPEDHVSPGLAAKLLADGIDPGAEPVRALSTADVGHAEVVIAFDEAAQDPKLSGARIWTTPSWNEDYVAAKAALAPQVEALLDELSARGCAVGKAG